MNGEHEQQTYSLEQIIIKLRQIEVQRGQGKRSLKLPDSWESQSRRTTAGANIIGA